jgi:hypothetical protein
LQGMQRKSRKHRRRRVDRPARIILMAGQEPCRIVDLSEGGALLTTTASNWLPVNFDLADVFSGARRAVTRVWSRHHEVGVRFDVGR